MRALTAVAELNRQARRERRQDHHRRALHRTGRRRLVRARGGRGDRPRAGDLRRPERRPPDVALPRRGRGRRRPRRGPMRRRLGRLGLRVRARLVRGSAARRPGIVFVGPDSATIRMLGDKVTAKRLAERRACRWCRGAAGRWTTPPRRPRRPSGWATRSCSRRRPAAAAAGIRVVRSPEQMPGALASARSEAELAFGDPDGLPGAVRRERPARRGPGDRRRCGHRLGGRRPGLQRAAPQPEGDRGVRVDGVGRRDRGRRQRRRGAARAPRPATATPARWSSWSTPAPAGSCSWR